MKKSSRDAPLRIGITYNIKRLLPQADPQSDAEAEFDSPGTVAAIRRAIQALGHDVIDLEATKALPGMLATAGVDLVFNIAEGVHGRNREAQVPALLEMLNIPYTGSDSASMTVTLDKGLSKKIVADVGVPSPFSFLMQDAEQQIPHDLVYPLIVKPVAEGSSKGITTSSVVHDSVALRLVVGKMVERYRQPALIEAFVGGREFTIGVFENGALETLKPMEVIFLHPEEYPVYSYHYKLEWEKYLRYDTDPDLSHQQLTQLKNYAERAFKALGCRDVARMDFRMDHAGQLFFLECNALPGLAPDWSDLCLIASAAGLSYDQLIHKIIAPGLKRIGAPC